MYKLLTLNMLIYNLFLRLWAMGWGWVISIRDVIYYCFHLQACTEMMLPSDTNNVTDMFPPYKYDPSDYCMDKWNVRFRPDWMKTQFWGKSKYMLA